MVETRVDAAPFWTERMALLTDEDRVDIKRIIAEAEPRRKLAKFNTGSITETAALALRALCAWVKPLTIIEVGTFIGVSTLSMRAAWIYTCDTSNDCLPSGVYPPSTVTCFPYRTSTQILTELARVNNANGVLTRVMPADLFFFDGLLAAADVPLILDLSTPQTVYVFDDYNGQFKGVQNVSKLRRLLPHHVLIPAAGPVKDDTTLAVLVPEVRL